MELGMSAIFYNVTSLYFHDKVALFALEDVYLSEVTVFYRLDEFQLRADLIIIISHFELQTLILINYK